MKPCSICNTWSRAGLLVSVAGAMWYLIAVLLGAKQVTELSSMGEEIFKTDAPQTVCFGRMQLELPKGANQQTSLYRYPGAYKELEVTSNVSVDGFSKTVEAFEKNLRATKHERYPSLLKSILVVPGGSDVKAYVHWEDEYSENLTIITGFARLNDGVQYKLVSEVSSAYVDFMSKEMISTLSRLRPRPAGSVPNEYGFCLDLALIPDDIKGERFERAEVLFGVAPWEGVYISVESEVNQVPPTERLLERLPAVGKSGSAQESGYQIIRAEKRTVGSYEGEELLARMTDSSGAFFLFVWEVQGAVKRNDPPDIHLELHVRQDGKPGEMTKEQALALWEYLLPRLKLRPVTAKPAAVSNAGKLAPIGELHVTGHRCPQTGWWECNDELNLAQPSGIWLEQGALMPKARVWAEPNWWQRLKGERRVGWLAAVWRLAAYEAPPDAKAVVMKTVV